MQGRPAGAGINGEARLMKSPLRYQISDYDCGPTSMLNAVLINNGKDINPQIKFKMVVVNPFTRTIKYWTKNTSNRTVKYVFYTKDNIFEEFPSKCSQNSKNTL